MTQSVLTPATAYTCACGDPAGCRAAFNDLHTATGPHRHRTRDRIVARHLRLAYAAARRFDRPSAELEELRQIAALALVEAVDRFDPERGVPFVAFAAPTIEGTLKRHFRDYQWEIHAPRRLKELTLEINAATELLTQRLRRAPTSAEIAAELRLDETDVRRARHLAAVRRPRSLDAPVHNGEPDGPTLADVVSEPGDDIATAENLLCLRRELESLPPREKRIIALRYFGNLTQTQIAEQVGCSQMQVSRLLRAAVRRLRGAFGLPPEMPAAEDTTGIVQSPARCIPRRASTPGAQSPPPATSPADTRPVRGAPLRSGGPAGLDRPSIVPTVRRAGSSAERPGRTPYPRALHPRTIGRPRLPHPSAFWTRIVGRDVSTPVAGPAARRRHRPVPHCRGP